MNKRLNNKNQMFLSVNKVCDSNRKVWENNTIFKAVIDDFTQLLTDIDNKQKDTDVNTAGITVDKNAIQSLLCEELYVMGSGIYAFASRQGNNILRAEVDFSEGELDNLRQNELLRLAKTVVDLAIKNIDALVAYNVSQADIDALQQLIIRFEAIAPEGRATVTSRMAAGEQLENLFTQVDDLLKHQLDRLIEAYRRPAPDFYSTYQNARRIVNYGIRHSKTETATTAVSSSQTASK